MCFLLLLLFFPPFPRYLCKSNPALVDSFESSLFAVFQQMLSMESAAEFSPYVFQLLAQLLEFRSNEKPFSTGFVNIFPSILIPSLWLNQGNVPALTRLLQAYLCKPTAWETFFVGNNRFNGVLGIFQELLRLRATEGYGLDLLTSIIVDLDLKHTNSSVIVAFSNLLFPKLQPTAKPTPRLFQKTVILFLAFIAKYKFDTVKMMLDQIQPNIFGMLFDKIVLANVHFLNTEIERKLGAIVLTDLTNHPVFLNDPLYHGLWSRTVLNAAKLVSPKESKAVAGSGLAGSSTLPTDEEDPDDLLSQSDKGFSTAYARLIFAAVPDRDYVAHVTQPPKEYVKQHVGAILAQHQDKLGRLLGALPQPDQALIQKVLQGQ